MRVVVCGSRTVTSFQLVEQAIESFNLSITELVSGGARGVDTLAENWAIKNGINVKRFPANWNQYGLSAGPIRNRQMADYCDCVIAVWDGESKGTKNMIDYTKQIGKPVYIHIYSTS